MDKIKWKSLKHKLQRCATTERKKKSPTHKISKYVIQKLERTSRIK